MDSMTCGYLKSRLYSGYLSGLHFDLRLSPGLARDAFPNIQYLFPQEKIYLFKDLVPQDDDAPIEDHVEHIAPHHWDSLVIRADYPANYDASSEIKDNIEVGYVTFQTAEFWDKATGYDYDPIYLPNKYDDKPSQFAVGASGGVYTGKLITPIGNCFGGICAYLGAYSYSFVLGTYQAFPDYFELEIKDLRITDLEVIGFHLKIVEG